jgi:hypothetical protein
LIAVRETSRLSVMICALSKVDLPMRLQSFMEVETTDTVFCLELPMRHLEPSQAEATKLLQATQHAVLGTKILSALPLTFYPPTSQKFVIDSVPYHKLSYPRGRHLVLPYGSS